MMMRLSVAGLLLATLAACGSSPDSGSAPPASSTPAPSNELDAGIPPKPDAAATQSYVNALNAIDPRIVDGKAERAVDRGRNQCSSIQQFPSDQAKLVDLTRQRFSTSVDFGPDAAARILAAVRKYICPTY
jgi:hypothetical protein